MRRTVILAILAAVLAVPAASAARLEDKPLFSLDRLSLGAQVRYGWWSGAGDEPVPAFGKEWEVGPSAAYVLTERVALVGSLLYGLDNRLVRTSAGVSVVLFSGRDSREVGDGGR